MIKFRRRSQNVTNIMISKGQVRVFTHFVLHWNFFSKILDILRWTLMIETMFCCSHGCIVKLKFLCKMRSSLVCFSNYLAMLSRGRRNVVRILLIFVLNLFWKLNLFHYVFSPKNKRLVKAFFESLFLIWYKLVECLACEMFSFNRLLYSSVFI